MKKNYLHIGLLSTIAILLILGFVLLAPGRAQASLGNVGIPARCLGGVGATGSVTLACYTPSGAAATFVGNQSVPSGYYFLVTDVMVTPAGSGGAALANFDLNNTYPSGLTSINHFCSLDGAIFSEHFVAPMWVLEATHFLMVDPLTGAQAFEISVNDFLVTNYSYMPVVVSP